MKVFVTGATGLIGSSAVRALCRAGHEVVGLTSRQANVAAVEAAGARAVVGDMRDAGAFCDAAHDAEAIVHAAAVFPDKIRYSAADVDAFMGADEAAVDALLSVAGPRCRAFVFSSGAFAYGDTGRAPVDETFGTAKPHAVMQRKVALENRLLELAKTGRAPVVISRAGTVYGDGSLWKKFYLDAMRKKQRAMMTGDGSNIISIVHEYDAGEAYRVLVEHGKPGEAYNVTDDEPSPLRDIVRAQAEALNAPPPRATPGFLIRLIAGPYSGPPTLANSVLSNKKLRALGWQPRYPTFREGVVAVARGA